MRILVTFPRGRQRASKSSNAPYACGCVSILVFLFLRLRHLRFRHGGGSHRSRWLLLLLVVTLLAAAGADVKIAEEAQRRRRLCQQVVEAAELDRNSHRCQLQTPSNSKSTQEQRDKSVEPHFEVLQLLAAFVALLNKVHKQRKANHKPVSPATGERGDDEVHHWHSGLSSENLKMLGVWAEEFLPD